MTQYCTFLLNNLMFGMEASRVQEVQNAQELTPVPLAPPDVCGVINLRGQILTTLDLKRRLELGAGAPAQQPVSVIVRAEGGLVSFPVDAIGDVLELSGTTFEPLPETLTGVPRDLIIGAHKLKDQLLLLLDVDRAVALPT